MKITFLGAAKTVTGSCFLIETQYKKFLIDCGMFQGQADEGDINNEPFPFNPADIDFMLLSHAHIDHSGRIPKLYLDGFKGETIATKATIDLAKIMLPDSGHIQEFEAEWKNRKGRRAGKEYVKPLYTYQDAVDCLKYFRDVKYGDEIKLDENIRFRFNDAGHVLGSSIVELWVRENGKETKIVFSGDLGNKGIPILRDPAQIEEADVLIIESTYGNRLHSAKSERLDKFVNIINETVERGGNVVIPSFAVGRTQEIIYDLNKHYENFEGKLDKVLSVPVYVDSPLAVSATEVFRNNLDCFDEEARSYIENGDNPLDFPGLRFTRSAEESKALNTLNESAIIISASGMCEAGRIKHHLKHNLWREDSTILFVGYQAEGTLGRRLLDGAKLVKIFGEEITVNARIEMLEGFSGHADMNGLLEWIGAFRKKPFKTFIVHGEENVMKEFAGIVKEKCGLDALIPSRGESFIIGQAVPETAKTAAPKFNYRVLELVAYLNKLRDEMNEAVELHKAELKKGKTDAELTALLDKLKGIEKSIVQSLKL